MRRRLNPDAADQPVFMASTCPPPSCASPASPTPSGPTLAATGVDPPPAGHRDHREPAGDATTNGPGRYLASCATDGVRIAIDDYGTGYASLSYLRQPGIDIVKIDRSFVREIDLDPHRTLLDAVITLTTRARPDQIAEGIEDRATRDVLIELGCRYGQGFLYAEPMPIEEALARGARRGRRPEPPITSSVVGR